VIESIDNLSMSKELIERWQHVEQALTECLELALKESNGQEDVWIPDWAVPLFERMQENTDENTDDNQDARIQAALKDYQENPEEYTYADLEAIFEDRDPVEFL